MRGTHNAQLLAILSTDYPGYILARPEVRGSRHGLEEERSLRLLLEALQLGERYRPQQISLDNAGNPVSWAYRVYTTSGEAEVSARIIRAYILVSGSQRPTSPSFPSVRPHLRRAHLQEHMRDPINIHERYEYGCFCRLARAGGDGDGMSRRERPG